MLVTRIVHILHWSSFQKILALSVDQARESPIKVHMVHKNNAAARDRLAQRSLWRAKLEIMENRQSILKDKRSEMMSKLTAVFDRIMAEPSHLDAG